jgi:hypothetical protein
MGVAPPRLASLRSGISARSTLARSAPLRNPGRHVTLGGARRSSQTHQRERRQAFSSGVGRRLCRWGTTPCAARCSRDESVKARLAEALGRRAALLRRCSDRAADGLFEGVLRGAGRRRNDGGCRLGWRRRGGGGTSGGGTTHRCNAGTGRSDCGRSGGRRSGGRRWNGRRGHRNVRSGLGGGRGAHGLRRGNGNDRRCDSRRCSGGGSRPMGERASKGGASQEGDGQPADRERHQWRASARAVGGRVLRRRGRRNRSDGRRHGDRLTRRSGRAWEIGPRRLRLDGGMGRRRGRRLWSRGRTLLGHRLRQLGQVLQLPPHA